MIPIEWAIAFQHWKTRVVVETDLAKDAQHIYAGLAVFIIVRLGWRWHFGWLAAWLSALVIAVGTEYLDILAETSNSAIRPDGAHWHDIWNTMFWPTVLALVGRWLHPKNVANSHDVATSPTQVLTDESA